MSKYDFLIWGNNQPDNFTKNIKEIVKFHKLHKGYDEDNMYCITCGKLMNDDEHNYGTDEYPQCILCGNTFD